MTAHTNLPPTTLPAAAYRSEAFAEDLFEMSGFRAGSTGASSSSRDAANPGPGVSGSTRSAVWLTGVPLAVALLGGVLAWWQVG